MTLGRHRAPDPHRESDRPHASDRRVTSGRRVRLDYGRHGLDVDMPPETVVVEPRTVPPLPDEAAAVRDALRRPIGAPALRSLTHPGDRVAIVHSDMTRPMPNDKVLPVLLAELGAAGVAPHDITLINALGTHRAQTEAEMDALLGPDVVRRYRCVQHDARDSQQLVPLVPPESRGPRPTINRAYAEADLKILTGLLEPHFFAGFSGGPKAVLPGIAGIDAIAANHGAANLSHPRATWGVTYGNPVWDKMLAFAIDAGPCFLLNVTVDRAGRLTGVFAGALEPAHAAGCDACRAASMVCVAHRFDVVVTTNAGHPLDLNLYQSVKGMSAARQITEPGGDIVIATECADGLPDHGQYAALLREAGSPDELLRLVAAPGFSRHDQWQAQAQAEIQRNATVHVFSDGLTPEQIRGALLEPCADVGATVRELLARKGPGATVCALPRGPMTVPYVDADATD